jgi:hypothetical protein
MPETHLDQFIRRSIRERLLTAPEANAIHAACEIAAECNAALPTGNEFVVRYGTRTAATLARMLEPIAPPEANGAPHGRQETEAPPLGPATERTPANHSRL